MKIKIIVILLIVVSGMQAKAQTKNSMVVDSSTKTEMLVGYCDKSNLEKDEYGVYFKSEYDVYKPAQTYITKLGGKLDNVEITIVFGTWCSDSQREVPRFYKVLNEAGYNDSRVKVIAVDKSKDAGIVNIKDLDIQKVPTFIIYRDDVEIGRIIETPKKSLEKDLLEIVK